VIPPRPADESAAAAPPDADEEPDVATTAPVDEDVPTEDADEGVEGAGGDQPTHGHLQIEGGERIALDRPVLFGRRPPETATIDDNDARVVTLAGSDALSRSHARFRFDGDDVQVEDLDSANHTYVTAPGSDPVRLRPNEPFTIEPGSVVSLADVVRITFEAD
jgi:pSer/pThr/pTyr-binding forkhead associated (FHA) protein